MYHYLLLNICFMLCSTNRHEKLWLKRSARLWSSYAVIDIGNIHCKCDYVRHSSCYYLDLTVIKIVSSHSTTAAEAPLKAVAYILYTVSSHILDLISEWNKKGYDNLF